MIIEFSVRKGKTFLTIRSIVLTGVHTKIISLNLILSSIIRRPSSMDLFFIACLIFIFDVSIPTIFFAILFAFSANPNDAPIRPGPIIVISLNLLNSFS